jgi:AP-2 complex subunit beta-1
VRKSVRAIGKLAIKIESSAEDCISCLLELVSTKVSYIVQEATVVIRNIFRKYPNRYESIIGTLCQNLDSLDEPEAKAAMIWIIGQYANRIENSDVLLDDFLFSFHDETVEVQLALLTATVKLYLQRPGKGKELIPKVLEWATKETDNPDLRDRGYMYWRLLSSSHEVAKSIVLGEKPTITAESERLDPHTLEEMCLNVGTLATVYLKPVHHVFRNARPKKLQDSPALRREQLPTHPAMVNIPVTDGINGTAPLSPLANMAAAADAADAYFSMLSPGVTSMRMEDGPGSPPAAHGERQYVVSQSSPQQAYHPEIGSGIDGLLD